MDYNEKTKDELVELAESRGLVVIRGDGDLYKEPTKADYVKALQENDPKPVITKSWLSVEVRAVRRGEYPSGQTRAVGDVFRYDSQGDELPSWVVPTDERDELPTRARPDGR